MAWIVLVLSGVLEPSGPPPSADRTGSANSDQCRVRRRVDSQHGGSGVRDAQSPHRNVVRGLGRHRRSLTVGFAMVTGAESSSLVKILLILGIVGCVVGLKVLH